MKQLIFIAVGGATGALLRFYMSMAVYSMLGRGFPYGTLVVNVVGSLLIGICYVFMVERQLIDEIWHAGLVVGLLGALTTFSTFSIETINLIELGEPMKAAMNILVSVILCMIACYTGLLLGRQI